MDTAFVTFIYPASQKFFETFLENLDNQTDDSFKLLVFNDGCCEDEIEIFFKKYKYEVDVIENTSNSISENRLKAIKYLARQPFSNFIFGDIDDIFAENRVEITRVTLKEHPIVFNELNICDKNLNVIKQNIIRPYLGSKLNVSLEMIKEQNLIGFSHVSMNKEVLNKLTKINIDSFVNVIDWVIMSKLLKEYSAFFESKTYTNYIFHENNLALFENYTLDRMMFLLDVKITTYSQLLELDDWYKKEMNELSEIRELIKSNKNLQQRFIGIYSLKEQVHYPWWSQIKKSEELKNELFI